MNEPSTVHPAINRAEFFTDHFLADLKANNASAFAALYDQYASILLGVITKIIHDEQEALSLLETTFKKVRTRIKEFQPGKQPLFVWLLIIARCTAIDALMSRKAVKASTLRVTTSGRVVLSSSQQTNTPVHPSDLQRKALVDAVLFKNCTPEEAAVSLDIPTEIARQQLRLAMQQFRTSLKPA